MSLPEQAYPERQKLTPRLEELPTLGEIERKIIDWGVIEREKPSFSLVFFARQVIDKFGDKNGPAIFAGLEGVFRTFLRGHSTSLLLIIAQAKELTSSVPLQDCFELLKNYVCFGEDIYKPFFLTMGYPLGEVEALETQVREYNRSLYWRGMLSWKKR